MSSKYEYLNREDKISKEIWELETELELMNERARCILNRIFQLAPRRYSCGLELFEKCGYVNMLDRLLEKSEELAKKEKYNINEINVPEIKEVLKRVNKQLKRTSENESQEKGTTKDC